MGIDLNSLPPRIKKIQVRTPEGLSGHLSHDTRYRFSYASNGEQVALAMPVQYEPYNHGALHPIFEMNLPEGFIRHQLSERLQRYTRISDMLFLAIQGDEGIGRLQYESDIIRTPTTSENLVGILSWDGQHNLFTELLERHLFNTTLSGMQPKVSIISDKTSLIRPDLIIKTGGEDYPHLALNEYICMTIAAAVGIATPTFWLSDNHKLFVMKRFDIQNNQILGMEDFAVLMGRPGQERYLGSYENASKVISLYTGSHQEMVHFFDYIVLSCLLGNGDAHLKNFSLLYSSPLNKARLSPIYDVVCTQVYDLEEKSLALKMNKSRDFPTREGILRFAKTLGIKQAEQRLEEMADIALQQLQSIDELSEFPALRQVLEQTISHTVSLDGSQVGFMKKRKDSKKRKTDALLPGKPNK
ncbi:MAG: type II toxin-antitoxin system HipA family toxin [Pseudomonadales bacterium]|nr:type II toxin-antitoxin system HipA family toxin [Pseudomonadales bacterium]